MAQPMNPFYRSHIGRMLADKPHLGYAVAFHVMYKAGIAYFAPRPPLDGGNCSAARDTQRSITAQSPIRWLNSGTGSTRHSSEQVIH